MKILVKLGGTLLDEPDKRINIARQLAWMSRQCELTVVHGGGKQVTAYLEDRGIKSEFVNGLRVSDDQVIDAVTKVIAGAVNKQLVASLHASGCPAVGISGVDGGLIVAQQLSEQMKFTGKPTGADGKLLNALLQSGYVPVVACIAGDALGNIYNVNADQLAVTCAAGWKADKLFFLTDVPGVKDENGQALTHLCPEAAQKLIKSGVAHGGMQAKLESCLWALEHGLTEVVIASGRAGNICQELVNGKAAGTRISEEIGVT